MFTVWYFGGCVDIELGARGDGTEPGFVDLSTGGAFDRDAATDAATFCAVLGW
jgi:hypothetical protein